MQRALLIVAILGLAADPRPDRPVQQKPRFSYERDVAADVRAMPRGMECPAPADAGEAIETGRAGLGIGPIWSVMQRPGDRLEV
jgi:hypothetical protein